MHIPVHIVLQSALYSYDSTWILTKINFVPLPREQIDKLVTFVPAYQRGILPNWSVLSPYQRSELTNVPVLLRIGGGRWGGQEDLPDRRKGGRRGLTPGGRGPTPGRRLTNWWWWWGRRDRPTGWGEKGGTLLKIKNKKINTAERKSYRFTFRIEKNMENGNQSNFTKSILVK